MGKRYRGRGAKHTCHTTFKEWKQQKGYTMEGVMTRTAMRNVSYIRCYEAWQQGNEETQESNSTRRYAWLLKERGMGENEILSGNHSRNRNIRKDISPAKDTKGIPKRQKTPRDHCGRACHAQDHTHTSKTNKFKWQPYNSSRNWWPMAVFNHVWRHKEGYRNDDWRADTSAELRETFKTTHRFNKLQNTQEQLKHQ